MLKLDSQRNLESGDATFLANAIRAGADLQVGTAFQHNEHVDPTSEIHHLVREVMAFWITYLLEDRWVAGVKNLRVLIQLPGWFGPRESMSLFPLHQDSRRIFHGFDRI